MKESDIQSDIMKTLGTHPDVAWAYVTSTGTFKGMNGGRPIKIGFTGLADIIGQMTNGDLLAIEVKQPGKKPTDEQLEFLSMVNRNNGVGVWCTSPAHLEEMMIARQLIIMGHRRD